MSTAPSFRVEWLDAVLSEQGPPLPTTRLCLMAIGKHLNAEVSAFPSVVLIANETALSERAVRIHLQHAVDAGWLVRESIGAASGQGWRRYRYRALIPEGAERRAARKGQGAESGTARSGEGAAPRSERCGTSFHNVRNDVPLNLPNEIAQRSRPSSNGRSAARSDGHREEHEQLFEAWYRSYPRKVARGQAMKAFFKLNPDADLVDRMIAALEAQKAARERKQAAGEWTPPWKHPATWLNAEAWLDEIEEPAPQTQKPARAGAWRPPHSGFDADYYAMDADEEEATRFATGGRA